MALKRKISKSDFDKLPKDVQSEYKASGDDYLLDIDGDDDVGELRRAHDREKQEHKDLREKHRTLQRDHDDLKSTSDGRRGEDIRTLEASWKDKLKAKEAELTGKIATKDSFIQKTLIDNVASGLANKISKSPALLLPHIKARLQADLTGDTPATRILDKDGKVSALTLEDLEKELVATKDFAPIIIASKASGSGGAGNPPNMRLGGAPQNEEGKPVLLSNLTPNDLAARITANKAAAQT